MLGKFGSCLAIIPDGATVSLKEEVRTEGQEERSRIGGGLPVRTRFEIHQEEDELYVSRGKCLYRIKETD